MTAHLRVQVCLSTIRFFKFARPVRAFVFQRRDPLARMHNNMVQITLPDGSQRQFPGPVTVAEVAQSIGSGLAKAALATDRADAGAGAGLPAGL